MVPCGSDPNGVILLGFRFRLDFGVKSNSELLASGSPFMYLFVLLAAVSYESKQRIIYIYLHNIYFYLTTKETQSNNALVNCNI